MKRKTLDTFIQEAKEIHGNKYDYSKVEYVNTNTKVTITCRIHGEFSQTPKHHLQGCGCPKCGFITSSKKHTSNTQEFIKKAKIVHGDKYNYSKVEYVNNKIKVCIICPIHGEFWQTPNNHLQGDGCLECGLINSGLNQRLTTEEFIKQSKVIHGDKYDYSKVKYINSTTKIEIICSIHGEFWQAPNNHLQGHGCNKCAKEHRGYRKSLSDYLSIFKEVHGDKYDYSKVEYTLATEKVCIICPIHGEFWQTPISHKQGYGCPRCGNYYQYTTSDFIEKARIVHGDRYDYSKVEYINNRTNVCIICREHGEFWQSPSNHLQGANCPKCKRNNLEKYCIKILEENNINYIHQYRPSFLRKGKSRLSLDIFLPNHNIAIECQGRQHFEPVDFFGGKETFKHQITRDKLKKSIM